MMAMMVQITSSLNVTIQSHHNRIQPAVAKYLEEGSDLNLKGIGYT
jgi:hypothetical protein